MSPSPSEVTAHNEGDCWGDRRCPCCAAEIAFDETGDDARHTRTVRRGTDRSGMGMTGSARVIRGNALALPLADASVDLVVTSPPYFGLRSYQDGGVHYEGQIGDEATPAEFVDALLAATREMVRVVKPSGSIWVNLGDKYAQAEERSRNGEGARRDPRNVTKSYLGETVKLGRLDNGVPRKSLIGVPWRYALRCIDDLGLILRAEVIWSKPNGLPESVTDRVRRSHETWFHFTREPRYFSAVDEVREKSVADPDRRRGEHGWRPVVPTEGRIASPSSTLGFGNPLGKPPGSVWTIPTQPLRVPDHLGVDHFAAFPMEWPRRIIRGWSPAGICVECGEVRQPVTSVEREGDCSPRRASDRGFGVAQGDNRNAGRFTITGYTCACSRSAVDCCGGIDCGIGTGLCPSLPPTTPATVLDPFGGTGTTALVARALGRHGISVDMSADYCRLAEWRVNDPGELARAMQVERPPKELPDQLDMFGGDAA